MATDVRALRSDLRGGFLTVCQWISRFAMANLLWAGLSILGVGIAGFFPSTVAMFDLIRRWLLRERNEEVAVLPTVWNSYRANFWRANALGYGLAAVGYLLYLDVRLFAGNDSLPARFMLVVALAACLVFALTVIYIGPVAVHLEMKWHEQIRLAAALGLSHPFAALHLLVTGAGLYLVFWQVPGLVVFFGGSVLATVAMWQLIKLSAAKATTAAG